MRRMFGALVVGLSAVAVAHGHALYIVPAAGDGGQVTVVFSDDLSPDARIKPATWKKFDGLRLTAVAADGKTTELTPASGDHCLTASAPAGTRVLFGQVDYGVSTKGGGKPTFVKYYPRAILGGPPADGGKADAALQIVPKPEAGKVRFQVLADGKPAAGVKVSVIAPEKKEPAEATTDEHGLTPAYEGAGRYGVTARRVEEKSGEARGEKYEQVSHVATLVVDVK